MIENTQIHRCLLQEVNLCLDKIYREGISQKKSAEISIKLAQYISLYSSDLDLDVEVLCMTFDAYVNEFLPNLKSIYQNVVESKMPWRQTFLIQNRQEHFFAIDMYIDRNAKINAMVIDSINQVVCVKESINPNFISSFGPWESKNVQSSLFFGIADNIFPDGERESLPIEVFFLANFPKEYTENPLISVKQAQNDNGSCAFFALYYAKILKKYTGETLDDFYKKILPSMAALTREKIDQLVSYDEERLSTAEIKKTIEYYPAIGSIHPVSWDELPVAFHAPTQSIRSLNKLMVKVKGQEGKLWLGLYEKYFFRESTPGVKVNTKILDFAYDYLFKVKSHLESSQGLTFSGLFNNCVGWRLFQEVASSITSREHGVEFFMDWFERLDKMPPLDVLKNLKKSSKIFDTDFAKEMKGHIQNNGVFIEEEAPLLQMVSPALVALLCDTEGKKNKKKKNISQGKQVMLEGISSGQIRYEWLLDGEFMMSIRKFGDFDQEMIRDVVGLKQSIRSKQGITLVVDTTAESLPNSSEKEEITGGGELSACSMIARLSPPGYSQEPDLGKDKSKNRVRNNLWSSCPSIDPKSDCTDNENIIRVNQSMNSCAESRRSLVMDFS